MSMIQPGAPGAPIPQAAPDPATLAVQAPAPAAPAAPAAPQPAAPAAPVPPVAEEYKVHPAWEQAMATIPTVLRGPLIEQIRTTEREAQTAIEAARNGSVPAGWQQFVTDAQAAGATPEQVVDAYNQAMVIVQDPVQFSINLNNAIDNLITSGQLTAKEGYRAKQEGQQQIQAAVAANTGTLDPNDPLLTPEQRAIAKTQKDLADLVEQNKQRDLQQQQQQTEAQRDAAATQYANDFIAKLTVAVPGDDNDPAIVAARQMIGRAADSMLANDTTNRLTVDQALAAVVAQATSLGLNLAPAAGAGAQQPIVGLQVPPVGVGSATQQQAQRPVITDDKAGKDTRTALMLAAAEAAKASS